MIGFSNSGSNTCRASENDPRHRERSALPGTIPTSENDPQEVLGTPSFFCTDFNSDACCNARSESAIGWKRNSNTQQQGSLQS
jgi:hypothetical protein